MTCREGAYEAQRTTIVRSLDNHGLGRSRDADSPAVEFPAADADVLASLAQEDRRQWLEQALAKLPEHQRVPLVLFHFEDLPYDEIARRLKVSLSKVKTDILRARAALAQILVRSGTTHESADQTLA